MYHTVAFTCLKLVFTTNKWLLFDFFCNETKTNAAWLTVHGWHIAFKISKWLSNSVIQRLIYELFVYRILSPWSSSSRDDHWQSIWSSILQEEVHWRAATLTALSLHQVQVHRYDDNRYDDFGWHNPCSYHSNDTHARLSSLNVNSSSSAATTIVQ